MSDEKRVLLVKPGDTVLIGNVGRITPDEAAAAVECFRSLDLDVVVFAGDIDIDLVPTRLDVEKVAYWAPIGDPELAAENAAVVNAGNDHLVTPVIRNPSPEPTKGTTERSSS